MKPSKKTYNKAKLFVVAGVHRLAFLNAAAVVGLQLYVEGDSPKLKDDVSLSLHTQRGMLKRCSQTHQSFLPFTTLQS